MIRGSRRPGARFSCFFLFFAFAVATAAFGQSSTGAITGRVVNQGTGAVVSNATVSVKGAGLQGTTDLSGVYRIENVPPGAHDLTVAKDGFSAVTVTGVNVSAGEPTTLDLPLTAADADTIKMESFTVSADIVQSSDIGLLLARQKAVAVSDAIGSEQFGRLAVSDAAEAMSKVTGASVVDGKYVLIRGLGDRYANTLMNGVSVPTADPDKRAVQMDQFPSDLLESITTTKSFTPDQPGAFSGGSVNLKTKSFPEQFFVSVSASIEYNDATTGEDLLTVDDTGGDVPDVPAEFPNRTRAQLLARTGDLSEAEELDRITKAFGIQSYFPHPEKADPNVGFGVAFGNRHTFGDQGLLGYTASVTYDREFSHYTGGEANRYLGVVSAPQGDQLLTADSGQLSYDVSTLPAGTPSLGVTSSTASESLGGFVKLAVRPTIDHEASLDLFFNRTTDDNVRRGVGEEQQNYIGSVYEVYDILYTERAVGSAQLAGKSVFPAANEVELAWRLSYSKSTQDQPDYRTLAYVYDAETGAYVNATGVQPNRYFRELDEDAVEGALDLTYPFSAHGGEHRFKAGFVASRNERTYDEQRFQYAVLPRTRDELEMFPNPVGIVSSTATSVTFGNTLTRLQEPNKYEGEQEIAAGYAMVDYAINAKLRAIGGVRFEQTKMTTVPVKGAGTSPRDGVIDQTDALPAISLVFAATPKTNWRLAYGRTIARPTFKELTDVRYEDVFTGDVYVGNPDLELTVADNLDLRWEWFPRKGETVAVSAFYKQLDHPIEVLYGGAEVGAIQPQNVEEGTVSGVEFEYRRGLDAFSSALSDFSVGANLTFVRSEVTIPEDELAVIRIDDPSADDKRDLLGQSPYVFNADLTYDRRSSGTVATLSYNIVGERLALVQQGSLPDVYEQPAGSLNLVVSQRLSDRWKLKLSAKNLLDPDHEMLIGFEDYDLVYERYREGRTYSISLAYLFE